MNWGIIGYGEIAPAFIRGIKAAGGQHVCAIASRTKHPLLRAAAEFREVAVYSDYTDLYNDPTVGVVYICTTNQLHYENVMGALAAGKHVLCEKPVAVNPEELEEILSFARARRLFFMEGMWTRFLPAYRHFKQLLADGAIGEINFIRADFGFESDWGEERRLKNKALYGGVILDNLDYPIFLCQDVFATAPLIVTASGRFASTGVEDLCSVSLQYPSAAVAQVFASFQQKTRQESIIYGKLGYIRLGEFWHGTKVELSLGDSLITKDFPFKCNGFEYEVRAVNDCIRQGLTECPLVTHAMSREVALIMETISGQLKSNPLKNQLKTSDAGKEENIAG
jgi:dihydrodiol dehydrogenase / D-xylose 1-dehydrogenase (NADP)